MHPPDGGEMYMIRTTAVLALVDSSFVRHKDLLLRDMKSVELDPSEIKIGFLTHLHCDHVGGMGWWKKEFGFRAANSIMRPAKMRLLMISVCAEISTVWPRPMRWTSPIATQ